MATQYLQPVSLKKSDGSDRRRSSRIPHVIEAWVCSPTDFEKRDQFEVTSVNLSRHGIAFDAEKEMPTGSFHVMEIGIGEQRMVSEVRIVSCRAMEKGIYEVGAEFC